MTDKHYALAREAILAALTAYTGITTTHGELDGSTLVDSNLINKNDFITNKTILIGSGDADKEDSGASLFDPDTGTITVVSPFSARIMAGTIYRVLNISTVEIDVEAINTKIGTKTDAPGTTTVFARLRQIVDTYLANGTIGSAAIKTVVDAILVDTGTTLPAALAIIAAYVDELETRLTAQRATNLDWLDITTFKQETVAATDVNGNTWEDLLDKSTITKPTKICGFKVTKGGAWAGNPQVRITDGSDNKIFPFQDQYEMTVDFADASQVVFNFPVAVPVADGYKFQFRSTNGADGAGETLQLNNLDVIEVG